MNIAIAFQPQQKQADDVIGDNMWKKMLRMCCWDKGIISFDILLEGSVINMCILSVWISKLCCNLEKRIKDIY